MVKNSKIQAVLWWFPHFKHIISIHFSCTLSPCTRAIKGPRARPDSLLRTLTLTTSPISTCGHALVVGQPVGGEQLTEVANQWIALRESWQETMVVYHQNNGVSC
jgi:hypothetical protein